MRASVVNSLAMTFSEFAAHLALCLGALLLVIAVDAAWRLFNRRTKRVKP